MSEHTEIVAWESIVGKDFLDIFTKIAIAEHWVGVKDLPIKTVHARFNDRDVEIYREKRAQMRFHGWRQSYLTKAGNLKFMVMYDPKKARYITLSEYIAKKDADRAATDEDEYYSRQDVVKQTTREMGKRTYKVHHDGEFVPETTR